MTDALLNFDDVGLVTANVPDPGAGADFVWTSTENTRILVISIRLLLTTDGTAANRRLTVQARQGPIPIAEAPAPGDQTATLAWTYCFAPCVLGIDGGTNHSKQWAPISPNFYLEPGHSVASAVSNLVAADQLSDIQIRYYQKMPR